MECNVNMGNGEISTKEDTIRTISQKKKELLRAEKLFCTEGEIMVPFSLLGDFHFLDYSAFCFGSIHREYFYIDLNHHPKCSL